MAIRKHTFTLLNKKYELDVADQLEEVYRMGERRLNGQLLEAMKDKTDGYDDRDYLARVALELATELKRMGHEVLIASNGVIIRMFSAEINSLGRATQGVRLINIKDGDSIAAISAVNKSEEDTPVQPVEGGEEIQTPEQTNE